MAENNRTFLKLPTAPLSRRIVFWVFVSVIVIETLILIPSLENRKQELLAHLRDLGLARIFVLLLSDGGGDGDALLAKGRFNRREHCWKRFAKPACGTWMTPPRMTISPCWRFAEGRRQSGNHQDLQPAFIG